VDKELKNPGLDDIGNLTGWYRRRFSTGDNVPPR